MRSDRVCSPKFLEVQVTRVTQAELGSATLERKQLSTLQLDPPHVQCAGPASGRGTSKRCLRSGALLMESGASRPSLSARPPLSSERERGDQAKTVVVGEGGACSLLEVEGWGFDVLVVSDSARAGFCRSDHLRARHVEKTLALRHPADGVWHLQSTLPAHRRAEGKRKLVLFSQDRAR
jgi:hypothetical protein